MAQRGGYGRGSMVAMAAGLVLACALGLAGCAAGDVTDERPQPARDGFATRMEWTASDGVTSVAEVRVVEDAYRMDLVESDPASVLIVRFDERLVWQLFPDDRTYITLGLTALGHEVPEFFAPDFSLQRSDEQPDSVEGTRTVRSTVVTTGASGTRRGTLWESIALPGRPVRWVDADSGLVAVFSDLRTVRLDPALFEVPDGYTEVEAPTTP